MSNIKLLEALQKIAYPANWPKGVDPANSPNPYDVRAWMQATAAKAITEHGEKVRNEHDRG